jgi:hypothetical protein
MGRPDVAISAGGWASGRVFRGGRAFQVVDCRPGMATPKRAGPDRPRGTAPSPASLAAGDVRRAACAGSGSLDFRVLMVLAAFCWTPCWRDGPWPESTVHVLTSKLGGRPAVTAFAGRNVGGGREVMGECARRGYSRPAPDRTGGAPPPQAAHRGATNPVSPATRAVPGRRAAGRQPVLASECRADRPRTRPTRRAERRRRPPTTRLAARADAA